MTEIIRVALCDDHAVVRSGLRRIIDDEDDLSVVGEAGSAAEAVSVASELLPDVFVVVSASPMRAASRRRAASFMPVHRRWW